MKALLLIDFQNDYFPGGSNVLIDSEIAVNNASEILNYFRNNNLPVIHIQHIANRSGATFFLPDTLGADIHILLKPHDNEKVFIKHYPNSFMETGLLEYVNNQKINELVICGMMTHMCVDATVRAAKDFGFTITVISDACATKDLTLFNKLIKAKDVHHSFLAALNYFYATLKTTVDFIES